MRHGQRLNPVLTDDVRLPARAQHRGHVRPVDVGVDQPDPVAHLRQRHGQVDRDRRLADAALARAHRHHMRHTRQRHRPLRHSLSCSSHVNLLKLVSPPQSGGPASPEPCHPPQSGGPASPEPCHPSRSGGPASVFARPDTYKCQSDPSCFPHPLLAQRLTGPHLTPAARILPAAAAGDRFQGSSCGTTSPLSAISTATKVM